MRKWILCLAVLLALGTAGCRPAAPEPTAVPTASAPIAPTTVPTPTTPTPLPPPAVDVPILMYHKVDTVSYSEWWMPTDLFARQMDALKAYGYHTITLQDFMNYRDGLADLPERPIILTFDDGYLDVYTQAIPILRDRGMVATLFIPTGLIGETDQGRQDNAWDPPEAGYLAPHMVWSPELATLYQEGFEIEAHTISHPHLSELSKGEAEREITESRTEIQRRLGSHAVFFSYPFGDGADDPTIRAYLEQVGYRAAVAAYPDGIANTRTSDIWALPRMVIYPAHSVDLDTANRDNFFMRRVDPGFPIPLIAIDGVAFRHAEGTPANAFRPGETITLVVTATNRGAPADVRVTLNMDDDGDHSATPYQARTVSASLDHDETRSFTFAVALPAGTVPGPQQYAVAFQDEYGVLGFLHSDWQSAFSVSAP